MCIRQAKADNLFEMWQLLLASREKVQYASYLITEEYIYYSIGEDS